MKKTFTKILCAALAMLSVSAVCAQQGYEKSNEIFRLRKIYNVVRIARKHMHSLGFIARNSEFKHLVSADFSLLNQSFA